MNFYTADLHFGQESLLATGKWKERPFSTLEEMHKDQIKKWNKKVTNGDDVYVLGDVGSRGYHHMHPELLAQLKGRKHLILGNHDDVSVPRPKPKTSSDALSVYDVGGPAQRNYHALRPFT